MHGMFERGQGVRIVRWSDKDGRSFFIAFREFYCEVMKCQAFVWFKDAVKDLYVE
jgi:hypothetical protein